VRIKKQDTSVTTLDKVFDLVEEQCEVVYFPQPALRERGRNLGLKMAREKDPKNIFEAAGSGKKKPEENSKITSFEEIFSRCQKMHEEIANTLDENLER